MIGIFNYFIKYELTYHFVIKVVACISQLGRLFFGRDLGLQNVIMRGDVLKNSSYFSNRRPIMIEIQYIN
jgi:hypothetical protein